MKKAKPVAALLTAISILFGLAGCQGGALHESELFRANLLEYGSNTISFVNPTQQTQGAEAENLVYGGIISPDAVLLAQLLDQVENAQIYGTVVVLASTDFKTETNKAFTYSYSGILGRQGIEIDTNTLEKLVSGGAIQDLGAVKDGSSWANNAMPKLSKEFTNAKFILISLNGGLSAESLEKFAEILRSYLPDKSLVLALSDFEKSSVPEYQDFQNKFARTVLLSFDAEKFSDLPAKNTVPLKLVAIYLQRVHAKKNLKEVENYEDFEVLYGKGPPDPQISRPIYLVSFGDIMLGRFVRTLMDKNGLDYPFKKMDDLYLKANDILLANLEGPIAEKAVSTTKGIAFRFLPDVAKLLKKYHFDVLSQANNHAFDMGTQGFDDSFRFLQAAGIAPFGNPKEIEERSFTKQIVRGSQIAFLGMEEVTYDIDDETAITKIKELTGEGYKVIPVVHWGIEYTHEPNKRQQELAHKFIDAGAVAVIAHHPHVVQSYENYNGRPIFYSLGNAIFDQYFSPDTQEGLSIAMAVSDTGIEIYLLPLKIVQSQMSLMPTADRQKFLERFAGYGQHTDAEKADLKNGHIILSFN
jgi:poly-gamma-glutamate synthesis protein (capsule biosynthesis protein)